MIFEKLKNRIVIVTIRYRYSLQINCSCWFHIFALLRLTNLILQIWNLIFSDRNKYWGVPCVFIPFEASFDTLIPTLTTPTRCYLGWWGHRQVRGVTAENIRLTPAAQVQPGPRMSGRSLWKCVCACISAFVRQSEAFPKRPAALCAPKGRASEWKYPL